jgi:hypothetical protein
MTGFSASGALCLVMMAAAEMSDCASFKLLPLTCHAQSGHGVSLREFEDKLLSVVIVILHILELQIYEALIASRKGLFGRGWRSIPLLGGGHISVGMGAEEVIAKCSCTDSCGTNNPRCR